MIIVTVEADCSVDQRASSGVARIITKALREQGVLVSLSDRNDINEEKFEEAKKLLRDEQICVVCGKVEYGNIG